MIPITPHVFKFDIFGTKNHVPDWSQQATYNFIELKRVRFFIVFRKSRSVIKNNVMPHPKRIKVQHTYFKFQLNEIDDKHVLKLISG